MTAVKPATFLVGVTQPDIPGICAYLSATGQDDFLMQFYDGSTTAGHSLCLVSMFAKLCYKSLVEGKNANVTKTRAIEDNLRAVINSKHGSVFEHVWLNFITTRCSRVFTHELVRHRVGTAFSQTSGRYVAIDEVNLVLPPELEDDTVEYTCPKCQELGREDGACTVCSGTGHVTILEYVEHINEKMELGLRGLRKMLVREDASFEEKKRLTSAIRRLAPNGQDNEIAWSCNVRSLRHMLEMRTSRHAEWEIRFVFAQVAEVIEAKWPLMLYGGQREMVDGLPEWTGLRI